MGEPSATYLFYNPDRWKSVSIDRHTVGPMGILELPEEGANDPRIAMFRKRGQLVLLSKREAGEDSLHGSILLRLFEQKGSRGTVVVSRTYAYGDILLASTVLDMLVERYPDNKVIFHTTERMEPLVRHHPDVEIITGDAELSEVLRTAGVFLKLDDVPELYEEHHPESGRNRIEIFAHYLGMAPDTMLPSYYISESEIATSGKYLEKFTRPFIGISPSTMRKEKSWRLEKWAAFAEDMLARTEGTIFNFDSQDALGYKHDRVIAVINKSLRLAGAIGWHMDVMVTQDSLWSHWAAALGLPQILLASCTDGHLLSKGYPRTTVVQRDWECVPCWYRFDGEDCFYGNYPKCLSDVNVCEVADVTMEALNDG